MSIHDIQRRTNPHMIYRPGFLGSKKSRAWPEKLHFLKISDFFCIIFCWRKHCKTRHWLCCMCGNYWNWWLVFTQVNFTFYFHSFYCFLLPIEVKETRFFLFLNMFYHGCWTWWISWILVIYHKQVAIFLRTSFLLYTYRRLLLKFVEYLSLESFFFFG